MMTRLMIVIATMAMMAKRQIKSLICEKSNISLLRLKRFWIVENKSRGYNRLD